MSTEEYKNALVEVLDILKHADEEFIEKIPTELIKKMNAEKSTTYIPKIDYKKDLQDNELLPATKAILTVLYEDYICTDEEKLELKEIRKENENKKEKLAEEKYGNDIFKNKVQKEEKGQQLVLVPEKKSFIQKFLERIFKKRLH